MGDSSQKATTNTSTDPWKPSQGYLTDIMKQGQTLFDNKTGYDYYPDSTVSPLSGQTTGALGNIASTAAQGNSALPAATGQIAGLLNSGGLNAGQQSALGGYQGVLDNLANGGNKNFEAALDYQSGKTADQVNRGFSAAGRYGSGANVGVLTDALAGQRASALSNQYNQDQSTRLSALGSMFNGNQQGVGNIGSLTGLLPTLDASRYYDANQALGAGQMLDAQNQAQLTDQVNRFNYNQQAPWSALGNYSNLIRGATGNYTTGQSTSVTPINKTAQLLGGGIGLASLL